MHLHLVTIHAMPSPQAVPLAAASLKVYLDSRSDISHPVNVTCSEFYSGTPVKDIVHAIINESPDIVGFPVYVWNRYECCAIAKELRGALPEVKILAGGPEVTASYQSFPGDALFDFLVIGEGELTVAEAMDRLSSGITLEGVPGIATTIDGQTVVLKRPPISDLSVLPSPWLAGLLDSHIRSGVVWQLSRGCSFGCDFCFDGMGDRKVRRYTLERLEAELQYVVQRGASQIFVLDSTFNQDVKRAKAILKLVRKIAPHVHCHFEVRHELLDAEQAELFASLTCSLQIGLQSADPEVAGNVGRKFNRSDFAAKINLLNNSGAVFGFDLIYGLPGDSIDRFREGLNFALSLYPNHLDIFPLSVLPGTRLAERAKESGLIHLERAPYTLIETPTFPVEDMLAARRLGAACDIFYSRGKAVAWFNGVVNSLGLSAVSFLEEFALFLRGQSGREPEESGYNDLEIWSLQRTFLTGLFNRKKLARLLPLALDFVDYHYHYASSIMAVAVTVSDGLKKTFMGVKLMLAESARTARFSYEILDLLESGEPYLMHLYKDLPPNPSYAVIYPRDGEVFTESLAEPYFRLLECLADFKTPSDAAESLGIPLDEAEDFLMFAVEEGIVINVT